MSSSALPSLRQDDVVGMWPTRGRRDGRCSGVAAMSLHWRGQEGDVWFRQAVVEAVATLTRFVFSRQPGLPSAT